MHASIPNLATLTSSTIGKPCDNGSDIIADEAPLIACTDFDGSTVGGSERFALRLPVLHESIDEEDDDDSGDRNVHDAMLMQIRLEASVPSSGSTSLGLSLK